MCRYAMMTYKPHYACFHCQKTFKRRLSADIRKGNQDNNTEVKCPECAGLMANMGLDFEAPKKTDNKAWQHVKNLYEVGITFFSCGCSGPGYIPRDQEAVLAYFEKIRTSYFSEFVFWRQRIEPETKQEKIKDDQQNWDKYSPVNKNYKKKLVSNQEGINYWMERVKKIEERIAIAKKQ